MCTVWVCISARYWKVRLGSGLLTSQAQWCCYCLRVVLCEIQQTDLSTCTATKVSVWLRFLHVDLHLRSHANYCKNNEFPYLCWYCGSPYKHKLQSIRHVILKPFWYFSISLMALFTT